MTQIHVLHTYSGKNFAEGVVRGLFREGYATFWDAENGPMSSTGIAHAERAVCVVVWTRDALYSKWPLESALRAHKRGALVELTLDPIESPIEGAHEPPLDFADWDGKAAGPLWAALMQRVRATAGRPTGKLPLKEEAAPAMLMTGLAAAAAAALTLGGAPRPAALSDSLASDATGLTPNAAPAVGGPQAGVREPASASPPQHAPISLSAPDEPVVTYQFDMLEPAPVPQVVPLKDLPSSVDTTDVASIADGKAKPNS